MLIWGLVLVLVVAGLSVVAWVWAVRRPVPAPEDQQGPEAAIPVEEPRSPAYVAIGNTDVNALFGNREPSAEDGWVTLLHRMLPKDTTLSVLGERTRMLSELNVEAIPATVQLKPTLVTLWNVVGDSTGGTSLTSYLGELRKALDILTGETDAQVVLLMLPDLTFLMQDQSEERKNLIRGGIEQWNRVIEEAATHYGSRVLTVNLYHKTPEVLDPVNGNTFLARTIQHELQDA
jgi:hypothetical protein